MKMNEEIEKLIKQIALADFELWLLRKPDGGFLTDIIKLVKEFRKEIE